MLRAMKTIRNIHLKRLPDPTGEDATSCQNFLLFFTHEIVELCARRKKKLGEQK